MVSLKILVLNSNAIFLDGLKSRIPKDWHLVTISPYSEEALLKVVGDIDVIVGTRASARLINSAEKLKMIQTIGTGADGIDVDAASERSVVVCSAVGLNAVPVAEHAMALLLSLAKNITGLDRRIRSEGWPRLPSKLLRGKTLGIVGLGSIGVEVAKRARAFDMRILAVKRNASEELRVNLGLEFLGGQEALPRIMEESDFIVLSIVLTPETRNMIGEKELRLMKKSAYLVNVSRGGVVDEEALIRVLKEGSIAGAGLDVFRVEPVSLDNPLLKLGNVVLTPHVAGGGGVELMDERADFIVGNIVKLASGERPEKVVDPKLKYVTE
ncbi:MAG: D-3-phosphoglycerate dehydrogenase / 2-oxoglutarate reductase [Thermoproteota archaeon]|nr:D-3-phosphoglycerate dehydrogenase / 2-oxoglutarate reductase [Thermoproteota archaeon]